MSLLKNLFRIGVTAGATVAAVRVSDKVKENNPQGVGDSNGDGKVDGKDMFIEVKKAAKEVYADAAAKAPGYVQKAKDAVNGAAGGAVEEEKQP